MEQLQQGFSDSTPKADSVRLQKSAKRLLSDTLILISISQKYWSGNFDSF